MIAVLDLKEQGYVIRTRNQVAGKPYYSPSWDEYFLTELLLQHGFISPPVKEIEELIALGVKIWMNQPVMTQEQITTYIAENLCSFVCKYKSALINDASFNPFDSLYYAYRCKDSIVEEYVNSLWYKISREFNFLLENEDLTLHNIEDSYVRDLVVRLITRGINYAVGVWSGNLQVATIIYFSLLKQLREQVEKSQPAPILYVYTHTKTQKVKIVTRPSFLKHI